MKAHAYSAIRVLAIDIASRGVGFALLEGPDTLVDWGFRNTRGKNRDSQCVAALGAMFAHYKPDALVLEEFNSRKPNRTIRVLKLINAFSDLANRNGVWVCPVSRRTVRAKFPSCTNKYDMARNLVGRFPELLPWCPPRRKIWMSEDSRINIFDALGLACGYLAILAEEE